MSGGQQQRVGIARAFVVGAPLILADEPTGNLDSKTTAEVMNLIVGRARQKGQTLVIVTHDIGIASYADKIVHIFDGKVEKIEEGPGIGNAANAAGTGGGEENETDQKIEIIETTVRANG
jgi:ABC-type lipoprotein export system ATPase subunit